MSASAPYEFYFDYYPRFVGIAFGFIAFSMLLFPAAHLGGDGISYNLQPVAGRAELRAYYFGTALCVAWVCLYSEITVALQTVALVLGGFASARVLAYLIDGVDSHRALRIRQHAVFGLEVLGSLTAIFMLQAK